MLAAVLRFQSPEYLNRKSIDQPSLILDEIFALLKTVMVCRNLRTALIPLNEFKRGLHVVSFSDCLDDLPAPKAIWPAVAKENGMGLFDPV